MHSLKVPKILAGARVKSKQAIGIKIVSRTVRAVQLVLGRRNWQISNAALRIHCDLAPNIDSAQVLVSIFRPSVVPHFPGARNGVEDPGEFPGLDIDSPNVSRRRQIPLPSKA